MLYSQIKLSVEQFFVRLPPFNTGQSSVQPSASTRVCD